MGYLQTIIWTMLFVVLVEMVFPSSDMKKYLKLVLGFIVVYIIISPVIDGLTRLQVVEDDALIGYIQKYQHTFMGETSYETYEEELAKQEEGILDIYSVQLKQQIQQKVEGAVDVEVLDVQLDTQFQDGVIAIDTITIEVVYAHEPDTIRIGIGEKDESILLNKEVLEKQIKNSLNNFYNEDNTNIYIIVQEK